MTGDVAGTTSLTLVTPDEVRWDEAGVMRFDGRETPVSRTLIVHHGQDDRWIVHFADGRVFHDWAWGASVEHACAPDDYTGVLAGSADRWTVRWEPAVRRRTSGSTACSNVGPPRQTERMARTPGKPTGTVAPASPHGRPP